MKAFNIIRKGLNYLSLYWLILLFGSVFYVYFTTGRIPEFSNPDPKDIISNFNIILNLYNLIVWLFICCVIFNIIHIIQAVSQKKKWVDLSMIFLLISIVMLFIQIFIDPFGFNDWFFD